MNGVAGMPSSLGVPSSLTGGENTAVSPQDLRRPQVVERPQKQADGARESNNKQENVDQGTLEKMVKDANQSLSAITSLHISLDHDQNRVVVQVVDKANDNKVIRQIPSENVLELSKRIDALKELKGFFLNTKA